MRPSRFSENLEGKNGPVPVSFFPFLPKWQQVVEEYEIAKTHYEKLGIPERIGMQLYEGVHEIHVQSGIAFLNRWLKEAQ